MRAVRTQFDAGEFSGTVATPTCCCSCCCCCCATAAATASIVGAGAAVVAGRRRGLPWWVICCGLLLGLIAPWLLIGPFLWGFVIPGTGGDIKQMLVLGLLLTFATYQLLGVLLRPDIPIRTGCAAMIMLCVSAFFEAFAVLGIIDLMETTGRLGTVVLQIYLVSAVVVAVVVGAWVLLVRTRKGRTWIERITGLPSRGQEEKSAGGGVS